MKYEADINIRYHHFRILFMDQIIQHLLMSTSIYYFSESRTHLFVLYQLFAKRKKEHITKEKRLLFDRSSKSFQAYSGVPSSYVEKLSFWTKIE